MQELWSAPHEHSAHAIAPVEQVSSRIAEKPGQPLSPTELEAYKSVYEIDGSMCTSDGSRL